MTAIITKQNVKDGAFIGGGNGKGGDGEFDSLHVKGDAVIDGTLNIKLDDSTSASVNEKFINHESRLTTLENIHDDNGSLTYEDGVDDFTIDANSLKTLSNDEYNILEIEYEAPDDYTGDVFEIIWSSNMGLSNSIISVTDKKFTNPIITFVDSKYSSTTVNDDTKPKIYISKTIMDTPLNLFTNGFIRINFIAKTKRNVNSKDDRIINFTCNQIDADNCFKLYRSPLPDFYEMKSYGIINGNDYFYADYGYIPGTDEFESLIDGQTFEFHDEAFGTDFKMTKVGNEWIGNNVSFHIPGSVIIKGETKFFKHQTQPLMIAQNETNRNVLLKWLGVGYNDGGKNPFETANDKGFIKFVDCTVDKYEDKDGYWSMYLKCTTKKSCNFSVSLLINGLDYDTEFGYDHHDYEPESCYKINSPNCYDYIPYHDNSKLQVGNPPYGLTLYIPNDTNLIFKIADVDYVDGSNPFEFLASTGFYTVSPRPESCTTLFTNYNIQTSGVVIGENIESHVFVLNSLGNTVDIAVNHISELQNYCQRLQQEIDDVRGKQNWFDIVKDVVCIAGSAINFMGGPGKLLSIAEKGISSLFGMSFAADEAVMEDAVIVACDRSSMVLSPGEIVNELDFDNEEELLDTELMKWNYTCFSLMNDYHVDVSFNVDAEGEVVNTIAFKVNEDLSLTKTTTSTIDCELKHQYPYLSIYSMNKPLKVEVKHIPKSNRGELGLGDSLRDDHILSSAATVKLIENHKKQLLNDIPKVDLTDYAKSTRMMEYTHERPDGTTQFIYTPTKPSNNFTLKITLRWINGDGEDDWYSITADVVNGKLTNKKGHNTYQVGSSTKYFSFQGVSGRVGNSPTRNIYYSNGVVTFWPLVCGDGVRDRVWNLINYDPDDTYFKEHVIYGSDIYDYALKSDIPTDIVNESSLSNTLNDYALKSDIPTDIVTESSLTNTLSHYVMNSHIEYTLEHVVGNKSNGLNYSDEYRFTIINPPSSFTTHFKYEWNKKDGSIGSAIIEVWIINGSFNRVVQPRINFVEFEGCQLSGGSAEMDIIKEDEITYSNSLLILRTDGSVAIMGFAVRDGIRFIADESYIDDGIAYKSDLNDYVLKSELPTDHVTTSSLADTLNGYTKKDITDTLSSQVSKLNAEAGVYICPNITSDANAGVEMLTYLYQQRNTNGIVMGRGTEGSDNDYNIYVMFHPNGARNFIIKSSKLSGSKLEIMYNQDNNLTDYRHGIWRTICTPNTTITHYCPIEAGQDISSFKVGLPVFASGHVYKQINGEWLSSTTDDRSDCICSVVIVGTYKEFVGVITSIDEPRRCITFATHGDFLFTVDDSNLYQIGDVILFNGKILDEDYAMTLRIQQSIVGKVTAKINETTLAIFRS